MLAKNTAANQQTSNHQNSGTKKPTIQEYQGKHRQSFKAGITIQSSGIHKEGNTSSIRSIKTIDNNQKGNPSGQANGVVHQHILPSHHMSSRVNLGEVSIEGSQNGSGSKPHYR